jgi:hypothetical protein
MLLATKLLRVGYPCHVSMALEGVQGLPQGPYIIMETLDAEAAGAELVIVIGFRCGPRAFPPTCSQSFCRSAMWCLPSWCMQS